MEQSVENFRQELIIQNPEVSIIEEVTLDSAIEDYLPGVGYPDGHPPR